MFEFIKKYSNGSFSFGIEDNLKAKCMEIQYENIDKCCGVYIVYGYPKDKGDKEIVYIGSSGHFEDNRPIPRKGGLRRRLYGRQKDDLSGELVFRSILWPRLMQRDSIHKLEICWYDTGKEHNPLIVEFCLILTYIICRKRLPVWNNELKLDGRSKNDFEQFVKEQNITSLITAINQ
ncbi:hypothetical protein [Bacteroides clarus]|jgi:hypothetical protein|uniref:hypothetical protein n=1 Tax=Bacteroides clarus TaxID=626929 RepID=UPI0018AAF635|nr:hypothetical protein [Bacteroides clarus]